MKVYFRKLREVLDGPLLPVYLITGDEPVQMRDAARMIRQRAKREGFDRRELRIIERGFAWEELPTLCSPSLFGDQAMLDMRVLSGKPDATAKARLKEWCEQSPEGSLITLQVPRLDNRALNEAWVRAIDKIGLIVRIMPMDERETRQWLQGALRKRELEMDNFEMDYFLSCVEGNLLAAEQELHKLHILNGPGSVSMESLQQSLGQDARYEAMDLAMAMLQGRGRRIISVARNLESEGHDPVTTHAMLMREIRQLLALSRKPSGLDSIFPFTRRDLLKRALNQHSQEHFRVILKRFIHLERVVKGQGPESPWPAIQNACLAFSGKDRLLPVQGVSDHA